MLLSIDKGDEREEVLGGQLMCVDELPKEELLHRSPLKAGL